jgi:hypothetical protein
MLQFFHARSLVFLAARISKGGKGMSVKRWWALIDYEDGTYGTCAHAHSTEQEALNCGGGIDDRRKMGLSYNGKKIKSVGYCEDADEEFFSETYFVKEK